MNPVIAELKKTIDSLQKEESYNLGMVANSEKQVRMFREYAKKANDLIKEYKLILERLKDDD